MGAASQNIAAQVTGIAISSGIMSGIPATLINSIFTPGDEVEYGNGTTINPQKLWVTAPIPGSLRFMDAFGNLASIPINSTVKIIRSGHRNMASMPIASVSTLFPNTHIPFSLPAWPTIFQDVLQTNATLYNNAWKVPITDIQTLQCSSTSAPPDSCLAKFLDSLIVHHQFFATPSDSIIFGKYCRRCGDSTALYCALTPPFGYDEIYNFSAQLGNCQLNFTNFTSHPICIDSMVAIYNPSVGCVSIGKVSYQLDFPIYTIVGQICPNSCQQCIKVCSDLAVGSVFNPYAVGMLGNWRPERNYAYYDKRTPVTASITPTTDIWTTGIFQKYTAIWTPGVPTWNLDTLDHNWTWDSRITMYDQKGNEIEDKDALGRSSSALYGYVKSLPTAVSSNAKYKDIAFDGFEDYGFTNNCNNPCDVDHWSYRNSRIAGFADTTSREAHTGKYSLAINGPGYVTVNRSIINFTSQLYSVSPAPQFILQTGGEIPLFSPDAGSYLLSAWVKESGQCGITGYKNDSIKVSYTGLTQKFVFKPSGPVIEGWQRFEGRFNVPVTAIDINVTLYSGGGTGRTTYYDDIRMQPFAAEMKTYVYDPSCLRLMATLDENNYATLYEYNDEGILMRVKKETERGIKTIKETRSSYPRK